MNGLIKEVRNGRMLKNNGSWMYCSACDKTVGYLCYTTYQDFRLEFVCRCGNSGLFSLKYPTENKPIKSSEPLKTIKNRLCCPDDDSPLLTIVDKNVESAVYSAVCKKCPKAYSNG